MSFESFTPPKEAPKNIEKKKSGFEPSHKIESVEDMDKVANWFQKEVDDFVENHEDFMKDHHFEELAKNLIEYLAEEKGIEINEKDIVIGTKEKTDDDEETTRGHVYLGGEEILQYTSASDGYGMNVDGWNGGILKKQLSALFEK